MKKKILELIMTEVNIIQGEFILAETLENDREKLIRKIGYLDGKIEAFKKIFKEINDEA
jgi:hypothetical protein